MFDGRIPYQDGEGQYWCEFERTLKGEYCGVGGQVRLDGLLLCNQHARQLRLEEGVAYWRAILAHVELWSGEARTRRRDDVVRLLEVERTRSAAVLGRILEDLEESRDRDSGGGQGGSGDGRGPPYGGSPYGGSPYGSRSSS
jgi:hypothetical protein